MTSFTFACHFSWKALQNFVFFLFCNFYSFGNYYCFVKGLPWTLLHLLVTSSKALQNHVIFCYFCNFRSFRGEKKDFEKGLEKENDPSTPDKIFPNKRGLPVIGIVTWPDQSIAFPSLNQGQRTQEFESLG